MISTQINSKNITKKTTNSTRLTVFQLPSGYHPTSHCYTEAIFVRILKKDIYLKIV